MSYLQLCALERRYRPTVQLQQWRDSWIATGEKPPPFIPNEGVSIAQFMPVPDAADALGQFFISVASGDIAAVTQFLTEHVGPLPRLPCSRTAVYLAAQRGHSDIVKELLNHCSSEELVTVVEPPWWAWTTQDIPQWFRRQAVFDPEYPGQVQLTGGELKKAHVAISFMLRASGALSPSIRLCVADSQDCLLMVEYATRNKTKQEVCEMCRCPDISEANERRDVEDRLVRLAVE